MQTRRLSRLPPFVFFDIDPFVVLRRLCLCLLSRVSSLVSVRSRVSVGQGEHIDELSLAHQRVLCDVLAWSFRTYNDGRSKHEHHKAPPASAAAVAEPLAAAAPAALPATVAGRGSGGGSGGAAAAALLAAAGSGGGSGGAAAAVAVVQQPQQAPQACSGFIAVTERGTGRGLSQ